VRAANSAAPRRQSTNSIGYLVPTDEWDPSGYEEQVSIDQYFGDVNRDHQIRLIQEDNASIPPSVARRPRA